jgi:hypothetical protein
MERELTSWKGLLPNGGVVPQLVASETSGLDASSIFFTDCSKSGRVPVLVYIVLVVPSLAFVSESQVECLFQRCR